MLIKEYRIPMPLSVEEYRIAQGYMVAKFSRERTTADGEGIQIVKNEPYTDDKTGVSGQFTHKIIRIGSHLPAWVKAMIPPSFCVEEKAWNAYPYVKNVYTCPFFGERFSIVAETRYLDNDCDQTNVNKLPQDQLSQCEVDRIDIVNEELDNTYYYKKEEDPKLFLSTKTGRGQLGKDWHKTHKPLMCIYKTAWVEFKVWGLQTKAEQWLQKSMVRDVVLLGHKQAFCWIDEWYGMNMEDIRKYEDETKQYLDKMLSGQATDTTTTTTTNNNNDSTTTTEQTQQES